LSITVIYETAIIQVYVKDYNILLIFASVTMY